MTKGLVAILAAFLFLLLSATKVMARTDAADSVTVANSNSTSRAPADEALSDDDDDDDDEEEDVERSISIRF